MAWARVLPLSGPPGFLEFHQSRGMAGAHRHEELEVNLVATGRATYLVGDRRLDLAPGSIAWFFPEEDHFLMHTTADLRFWLGVFRPDFVADLVARGAPRELRARTHERLHRRLGPRDLARATAACEASSGADGFVKASALSFALLQLWQLYTKAPDSPQAAVHPAVTQAALLLKEDPSLQLANLARRLELSPDHLERLFKEEAKQPLSRYRTRMRLEKVLHALEPGGVDLSSAALCGGFGSYSAFHRAFKAFHGMAPRAWRKGREG